MQELEAAETLQAAVMQQKSFSFPLTEEDKKEKKKKTKYQENQTAQPRQTERPTSPERALTNCLRRRWIPQARRLVCCMWVKLCYRKWCTAKKKQCPCVCSHMQSSTIKSSRVMVWSMVQFETMNRMCAVHAGYWRQRVTYRAARSVSLASFLNLS